MILKKWEDLPQNMQNDEVKAYYDILASKKASLILKSIFDRVVAFIMLLLLSPIMLVLAIWIKLDSQGEVFFRQERITQYGKVFKIHKFRTMVKNAESIGSQVTTSGDVRITKVGSKLRSCRLDELPQLIDILQGNMSFVGTRPEVKKYVDAYTPEMMATLLLPAGVTSEASIKYKDEENLLNAAGNVDEVYIETVLPEKMKINLENIKKFSFMREMKIMLNTLKTVL